MVFILYSILFLEYISKILIGEYCFRRLSPQVCLLILAMEYSGTQQMLICYKTAVVPIPDSQSQAMNLKPALCNDPGDSKWM